MVKMKKQKEKIDLDKEVRNIGIALIILGVIHFVLSQFLDFTWGFVRSFILSGYDAAESGRGFGYNLGSRANKGWESRKVFKYSC